MAQVALNADLYAAPRQNKFFKTVYANLEGQCVTLVKCFMQDMSSVPNPHAARGDARYVGKALVAQGHATEVPYSQRKRGDLVVYEYGTYGHIGVQLSGGRIFEQNVNMGGVASKIVDGQRVYASRIGSENEAWRANKNPHIYRLKTYKEGVDGMGKMNRTDSIWLNRLVWYMGGDHPTEKEIARYVGKDFATVASEIRKSAPFLANKAKVLAPAPPSDAVVLKPGKYEVK